MLDFQTRVIALQVERETAALAQAKSEGCAVVVCDRGVCDSRAYLGDDDYLDALRANGMDRVQALARYDAVFHLDSIAKDDPEAYTRANNAARLENAQDAARVNERVLWAWAGHPALHVIGNRADFGEKAGVLFNAMTWFLELPQKGASRQDVRPVLVSACLLGVPCRYDGRSKPCETAMGFASARALVPVCPEQLGGLPTPRTPSEMQPDGRVVDAAGIDRTAQFEAGAREALRIASARGCKLAILKENSPSCGPNYIYDGSFSGALVRGRGKAAALLAEAGIEVVSESYSSTRSNSSRPTPHIGQVKSSGSSSISTM